MQFLYFLENIRFPLLNELMLLITRFGEETAFLVTALIVFWCVDKKRGYYILVVGFLGTILNQFLKLLCKIPRPWVLDPNFEPIPGSKEAATGYSFPSGHSQSAVGTFGCLAVTAKEKTLRWIFAAICLLVPFSRMYLGVHTPADVLVGSGCALVLIFAMRYLNDGKVVKHTLLILSGLSVLFFVFVQFILNPQNLDAHNYASGLKNAYTLLGSIFGMLFVHFVDEKWLHFEVKAVWWAQILKVCGGLGLVLAVKEGLRVPINALLGEYPGRAVRYFLIVLTAGILWPLTFRWFSSFGKKEK
jgi:undecaprenyl-diphosphatase